MEKKFTDAQRLCNYFFRLKGWDWTDPKYKPIYARWVGVAKRDLLPLADGDALVVKAKIDEIKKWADKEGLSWNLGTVEKRWLEKNETKKEPFTKEGDKLIKRGTNWLILNWDGRFLDFNGSESSIIWK